jgi:hypothetical protein
VILRSFSLFQWGYSAWKAALPWDRRPTQSRRWCRLNRTRIAVALASGQDIAAFREFFVAVGGGFAALLGLLFVAFTLRWEAIQTDPRLHFPAIGSTQALVVGVMGSLFVLLPGQPRAAVGWEILGLSIIFAVAAGREVMRVLKARPLPSTIWARIASAPAVTLVGVAAGISLIIGRGPGLYIEAVLFITARRHMERMGGGVAARELQANPQTSLIADRER